MRFALVLVAIGLALCCVLAALPPLRLLDDPGTPTEPWGLYPAECSGWAIRASFGCVLAATSFAALACALAHRPSWLRQWWLVGYAAIALIISIPIILVFGNNSLGCVFGA